MRTLILAIVGTVLGAAAWVVTASALYLWFIGGRLDLFVFPYDQWIEVLPWWNRTGWMEIYVIGSAAVPSGFALLIVCGVYSSRLKRRKLRRPAGGGLRPIESGVTDNHGHARWMTMREARRLFPGPAPGYGGVVVGEAYRVDQDNDDKFDPKDRSTWGKGGRAPLLIDDCTSGPGHSLLFAGSGGFKTVSAVVSTLLEWTGSSVALDPSREVGPMLRTTLEDTHGKTVHFLDTERPDDAERWGFNALDWINITESKKPEEDIYAVVSWMFGGSGKESSEDRFFIPFAKALVACLLADLLWDDAPLAPKTLATLRSGITTPEPEMKKLLRGIHHSSKSTFARQIAGTLMDQAADKQFSGIYGTAVNETHWLSIPTNADLVSGDAFKTADLIDGNTTVFVQIPIDALGNFPGVARVIIGSLMKAVYRAEGNLDGRVLFELDEAYRLGYMKIVEEARDAGRKYGITMQLVYQSVGQLKEQWGMAGKDQWYSTVSWRGYAAVRDVATADELSKEFGHYSVLAYSEGDNTGTQSRLSLFGGSRSRGHNTNVHEIKRPVMFPHEIMQESRPDELFVVGTGDRPLRCGRAIYFRRPEMNEKVETSKYQQQAA